MYFDYLRELSDISVLETSKGFALYKITNDECYIQDIYVKPEYRNSHVASEMANEIAMIAKKSGSKFLTGTVVATNPNATTSMKVLLSYGMKFHGVNGNMLVFMKEI